MMEGGSASYSIRLSSLPKSDVAVTVELPTASLLTISSGSAPVTVAGAVTTLKVTLDASNWDTGVTVALAATSDDVDWGPGYDVTLTHSISGGDGGLYSADASKAIFDPPNKEVRVAIVDNDVAGVALSTSSLMVLEGGAAVKYKIRLLS